MGGAVLEEGENGWEWHIFVFPAASELQTDELLSPHPPTPTPRVCLFLLQTVEL